MLLCHLILHYNFYSVVFPASHLLIASCNLAANLLCLVAGQCYLPHDSPWSFTAIWNLFGPENYCLLLNAS
jgi:hypothetical protein